MKIYFGQQIKPEYRGDLAALIYFTNGGTGGRTVHPANSQDFIDAIRYSRGIERIYLGLNQAGQILFETRAGERLVGRTTGDLDSLIVEPWAIQAVPEIIPPELLRRNPWFVATAQNQ